MKRLAIVTAALALAGASAPAFALVATKSAENVEWKQWSLWCRADVLDDYGEIRFHRSCTAYVSTKKAFEKSVPIFEINDQNSGLASAAELSDCDYQPQRVAVDGRRIDNLDRDRQMEALYAGKSLIREVWKLQWPECEFENLKADITGAKEAWERLLKLKAKIYDKNIAYHEK